VRHYRLHINIHCISISQIAHQRAIPTVFIQNLSFWILLSVLCVCVIILTSIYIEHLLRMKFNRMKMEKIINYKYRFLDLSFITTCSHFNYLYFYQFFNRQQHAYAMLLKFNAQTLIIQNNWVSVFAPSQQYPLIDN